MLGGTFSLQEREGRLAAAHMRPDAQQTRPLARMLDGVRFSLDVPLSWERHGTFRITRSTVGPQGAEAVVFWTVYPTSGPPAPCKMLASRPSGQSAAGLAKAMAGARGTKVVKSPRRVSLGGRPAWHLVLRVRNDRGCDPGFFFVWRASLGGAFWNDTDVGTTIRAWIVAVGGKLLVLEAETNDHSAALAREISTIAGSLRFR
jgi:hypothetical protein